MKNKKAQTLGIAVIVSIVLFIIGMVCVSFIKDEVTRARGTDGLDCSNTANLSDGGKLTCLTIDFVVPYFIVIVVSLSGGMITSRFLI